MKSDIPLTDRMMHILTFSLLVLLGRPITKVAGWAFGPSLNQKGQLGTVSTDDKGFMHMRSVVGAWGFVLL